MEGLRGGGAEGWKGGGMEESNFYKQSPHILEVLHLCSCLHAVHR